MPLPLRNELRRHEAWIDVGAFEYSATLGQIIGLAYAGADQAEPGMRIPIRVDGGQVVQATVVQLPFFDPDNQRQEL